MSLVKLLIALPILLDGEQVNEFRLAKGRASGAEMSGRPLGASGEEKGWNDLVQLEPSEVCRRSLASYDRDSRKYTLRVLNVDFDLPLENRTVVPHSQAKVGIPGLGIDFHIMILDYLANCSDIPLSGRLVSGVQLKGGEFFFRGGHGLELGSLVNAFGNDPEQFKSVGLSLGGKALALGDVSFQVPVLPKVPVAYVLWAGDEEFSARLSVLFDSTADCMLHLETLRTAAITANRFLLAAITP